MENFLEALYREISTGCNFTSSHRELLLKRYGDRYLRALELVENGKVKKYVFNPSGIERWTVEGRSGVYLVIPRMFCQCNDFYISVVMKGRVDACYHLIAQFIAEADNNYVEEILSDGEYVEFMRKFRYL